MNRQYVLASGNPGKLSEMSSLLQPLGLLVRPQSDWQVPEADETATTFIENSLIKAHQATRFTGLPAIADDSGLAVDALQGRPGVFSARYAGPVADDAANIDKLLNELAEVDDIERGATFHCVACFVTPDSDDALIGQGSWRGSIARHRIGDGGFGYDPVFIDAELGVTSAQLSAEEKNQRSHRGKALAELARLLGAR